MISNEPESNDAVASEAVASAVLAHIDQHHHDAPGVASFHDRLGQLDPAALAVTTPAQAPPRAAELGLAIDDLCASSTDTLAAIGTALRTHALDLSWRTDEGNYYATDAPVGDGYRLGNMHALLAEGNDFAMGLFLLKPGVDYLDHHHAAPELYLNLTGPTQWRFNSGEWTPHEPGSMVWNPPGRIHATRSGERPWLSFWAWLNDIDSPCQVVESSN